MTTLRTALPLGLLMVVTSFAAAATPPDKAEVTALRDAAQAWLLSKQQPNGSFFPDDRYALGVTELATLGLLEGGMKADSPPVAKALDFIRKHQQPDGGIYSPEGGLANYGTSLGLMVFAAAGLKDDPAVAKAQQFLLGIQNSEGGINDGGLGYGSRGKGNEDLSNTSTAIEALRATGIPADHPAMKKALEFIQRCQNHSATNKLAWAKNDGGAVYSPDSSKAGGSYHDGHAGQKPKDKSKPAEAQELASYGSMTYALIKSYIYLNLKPEDPRVAAAVNWVKQHYQFERNPGLAADRDQEGLFYYYNAMAKTFDLMGITQIDVPGKGTVDWRADLFKAILDRSQKVPAKDGKPAQAYWINAAARWGEGLPQLSTAYHLVSLNRVLKSLETNPGK